MLINYYEISAFLKEWLLQLSVIATRQIDSFGISFKFYRVKDFLKDQLLSFNGIRIKKLFFAQTKTVLLTGRNILAWGAMQTQWRWSA